MSIVTNSGSDRTDMPHSDPRYNELRLEMAADSADLAWWEMEMPSGKIIFHKRKAEMLGYPPEDFSITPILLTWCIPMTWTVLWRP